MSKTSQKTKKAVTSQKELAVYLNKIFTGIFAQDISGALSFTYDETYLKSKNAARLSASLPLSLEPFGDSTTRAFFSGLLPDGEQLISLAEQLKSSDKNPFALLFEIGRDCAGAIEILPTTEKLTSYQQGSTTKLGTEQLYEILGKNNAAPLMIGNKKNRLSLAGAQRKLAVFFDEKKNELPELVIEKPSTHILKPTMPRHLDSVHNEFFCMKLAKEMGFDVAEVFLKQIKERPYLLIRRYDRKKIRGVITRIHQEDFCQALGLSPEQKYQGFDGGPGIEKCKELINQYSLRPAFDQHRFLRLVIFNYIIGNSDAHGKNFSFLYEKTGMKLAPFYDLLSTALYAQYEDKMAMKIGKATDPERTFLIHWNSIVADTNTARSYLKKELKFFATQLPENAKILEAKLKKQKIESEVFIQIQGVIKKRSEKILKLL
jgi:serine/threonine-protein kinase HipA